MSWSAVRSILAWTLETAPLSATTLQAELRPSVASPTAISCGVPSDSATRAARRGSGVPVGGAFDDLAHAVEPPAGGDEWRVPGDGARAARSGVLDAEFELRITIYFHFHGDILKCPL